MAPRRQITTKKERGEEQKTGRAKSDGEPVYERKKIEVEMQIGIELPGLRKRERRGRSYKKIM